MVEGAFNGKWEFTGKRWGITGGKQFLITVPHNIGYNQLVEQVSKSVGIDRRICSLVLSMTANDRLQPTKITSDDDVRSVILRFARGREILLCVKSVHKEVNAVSPSKRKWDDVSHTDEEEIEYWDSEDDEDEDLGDLDAQNMPINCTLDHELAAARDRNRSTDYKAQMGGKKTKYILPPYAYNEISENSNSTTSEVVAKGIHIGKTYPSKTSLLDTLCKHAIDMHFQISTYKSSRHFVIYVCKEGKKLCPWRLRANYDIPGKEELTITVYESRHTCGYRPLQSKGHSQATTNVLGGYFKENVVNDGNSFKPRNLQTSVQQQFGVTITYEKAYRCRERSIQLMHGTPEEAYATLPAYFHMLLEKNPFSVADIAVVDSSNAFLYCFLSLGASRLGFKKCRPIICVDGTHLRNRYHGTLLCAIALDVDDRLFPLAFAIVDNEDDASYDYFMSWLKKSVGNVEGLVFISDRHVSIGKAIETHFPDANHGVCYHHLKANMKRKYPAKACRQEFKHAAYAFTKAEFWKHFIAIKGMNKTMADELEEIGFSRWARAYFPEMRYAIATNNYCESFHSKLLDSRKWAITSLLEYIRAVVQRWHYQRLEGYRNVDTYLAPNAETTFQESVRKSRFLTAHPISGYKFHVTGPNTKKCVVDLQGMNCECGKFTKLGIPCEHVAAAVIERKTDLRHFCSPYFTTKTAISTYETSVSPCPDESEWIIPDYVQKMIVSVPTPRPLIGRPKKRGCLPSKRIPSEGENQYWRYHCSNCKQKGHNKATCRWKL